MPRPHRSHMKFRFGQILPKLNFTIPISILTFSDIFLQICRYVFPCTKVASIVIVCSSIMMGPAQAHSTLAFVDFKTVDFFK